MTTRRPHKKSRNGCTECKRRKVKCDEKRPSCFNCTRLSVLCSLGPAESLSPHTSPSVISGISPPLEGVALTTNESGPAASGDFTQLGIATDAERPPPLFSPAWGRELELMHHYSTCTYKTLALRSDMRYVWKTVIPEEGYNNPFVMHGLLALSAAHKAHLLPSERETYLSVSAYHQSLGLEAFRPLLPEISRDNWKPMFCYASIVALYACLLPTRLDKAKTSAPIAEILELFRFIRGIQLVLQPFVELLPMTRFSPLVQGVWIMNPCQMEECEPSLEESLLPKDIFEKLANLRSFLQINMPIHSITDYEAAVSELVNATKLIGHAGLHVESGMVLFWPYVISETVLNDIQALDPYALLLLSHYAVLLMVMEARFWFIKGWGIRLLADINVQLSNRQPFIDMVKWPSEQVYTLYKYQ
ncbi:hypothetical protein IWW34DRAFT_762275 [Fusarium oxysporum f. sp. albedinis]|nr:hypothetical protein IWW34DRAFT_762275 [Fusarium oxysporum f. sp. albedinis]KAJ0135145.1 Uncharacterized protein HZ326_21821 [Fusarium oxysporum f. sp. albedinis]